MKEYLKQIGKLPGSVKFFIITEIIKGLGMGIWNLNLNFFLMSRGLLVDQIGLLVSISSFSTAVFAIAAGAVSDRLGYRNCMLAGFLLKALAMTGTALVSPISLLYLLRAVNGMGDCLIMVCSYPFITSLAPEKDRNMVYGLLFSASMLSQFFGNITSGFISNSIKSYTVLILTSAVIICVVAGLRFFLPVLTRERGATGFRFYLPKQKFIGYYLVYEMLGYVGYFLAYSMVNVICKSKMGLSDDITGLISGIMTLVSGTAIFIIPAITGRLGRAGTNSLIMVCLIIIYTVMAFVSGIVFIVFIIVTAAMQCMMAGLIDGPILGAVPESEKGGFSGLMLLLQNIGTSGGIFLAGIVIKNTPNLSILYLAACLLIIIQLLIFVYGIKRHIADETMPLIMEK